jgi:voltage-gated potassium channel
MNAQRLRRTSRGRRSGSSADAAVIATSVVVTVFATAVVIVGGSLTWLLERNITGATFRSWGDAVWWALTTLTTVGYGDHVPVTVAGRLLGAAIMVAGVAVLGGVAAGVALVVARAVARTEEQALEAEAESLEHRLEIRLDVLDARLARMENQLRSLILIRDGVALGTDAPGPDGR